MEVENTKNIFGENIVDANLVIQGHDCIGTKYKTYLPHLYYRKGSESSKELNLLKHLEWEKGVRSDLIFALKGLLINRINRHLPKI